MYLIKASVPITLMVQFLMILYAKASRGSKKLIFTRGYKRCIKNELPLNEI